MAAADHLRHLALHLRNVFGARGAGEEPADEFLAGVILHQRERDDHRLLLNLRETERGDALAEDPDDREGQLAHAEGLADGVLESEDALGERLGNQTDFAARLHIEAVEETPAENHEAADGLVAFGHADEIHGLFDSGNDHGHGQLTRARNLDDVGDGPLNRLDIALG